MSNQKITDQFDGVMEINGPDEDGDMRVTVIDGDSAAEIFLNPERAAELISILATYLAAAKS